MQVPPGATAVAQVFVCAKSAALVPATVTPETVSGADPEFVTVTVCGADVVPTSWLPNVSAVALSVAAGAVPVPERATATADGVASVAMVRVPVRPPVAPGVKVTATVQDPPAGTVAAQPDAAKSAALVPVTVTPLTVSGAVPGLDTVTLTGPAVPPTRVFPKAMLVVETETAGATPMPVSAIVAGPAFEATVTVADRAPVAPGVKVRTIEQVPPGATAATQPDAVNSVGLTPPSVSPVMLSGPVPVFVTVTVFAGGVVPTRTSPKAADVADSASTGWTPLPDRATAGAVVAASLTTCRLAVRAPVAPGAKVTLTVHDPPGATTAAQPLAANSDAFAPVTVRPDTVSGPVPGLDTVTVCAAEVLPTAWSPKARLAGASTTCGVMPVPVRATTGAAVGASEAIVSVPVFAPSEVGVKVTSTVHVPPGATAVVHPVAANCAASVPPRVRPETVSGAEPVFVTVTVFAVPVALVRRSPKARLAGATEMPGTAAPTPLPVRASEPVQVFTASLGIVSVAVRAPGPVGVKVTETVHAVPTGWAAHVFAVTAKSPAFAPVTVGAATVRPAVPTLVTVTVFAPEVVPTSWLPKASFDGTTSW